MELANWWHVFGIFSYLMALAAILNTLAKKPHWELYMFFSLSSGVFTMIAEYQLVARWVQEKDWSALEDVVPFMSDALLWLVLFGVLLNAVALVINLKRKSKVGNMRK